MLFRKNSFLLRTCLVSEPVIFDFAQLTQFLFSTLRTGHICRQYTYLQCQKESAKINWENYEILTCKAGASRLLMTSVGHERRVEMVAKRKDDEVSVDGLEIEWWCA